ncbi:MAG: SEC-C metal-binding domain-containing protein [Actinomycetota bacterium]
MDLERGTLARIDRKLLAGLGDDEAYRTLRVPVTASKWSTWKRYCESAGVSMGRAIVTLIDRELVSAFGDHTGDYSPVLAEQAEEELTRRQEQVARREENASVVEERFREWNEHLRRWEGELETRERRVEFAAKMSVHPGKEPTKIGRNERCPCGSGLKYKHCHGRPGRP